MEPPLALIDVLGPVYTTMKMEFLLRLRLQFTREQCLECLNPQTIETMVQSETF